MVQGPRNLACQKTVFIFHSHVSCVVIVGLSFSSCSTHSHIFLVVVFTWRSPSQSTRKSPISGRLGVACLGWVAPLVSRNSEGKWYLVLRQQEVALPCLSRAKWDAPAMPITKRRRERGGDRTLFQSCIKRKVIRHKAKSTLLRRNTALAVRGTKYTAQQRVCLGRVPSVKQPHTGLCMLCTPNTFVFWVRLPEAERITAHIAAIV